MGNLKETGKLVLLAVFAGLPFSVFGFEPSQIEFATSFGAWYGSTGKIVFLNPTSDEQRSLLVWDVSPVFKVGAQLRVLPAAPFAGNGFYGLIKADAGLPGKSGIMQYGEWDPDWDGNPDAYDGNLTYFSEHTNETKSLLSITAALGWSFIVVKGIALRPYLEFGLQRFSFSAEDGYLEDRIEKWKRKEIPGTVITFTQSFYTLGPGLLLQWLASGYTAFDVFAQIGYVFYYGVEDNRLLSNQQFLDNANRGVKFGCGFAVRLFPANRVGFDMAVAFSNISYVRGDIVGSDTTTGVKTNYGNVSGAGLSLFDVDLAVVLRW